MDYKKISNETWKELDSTGNLVEGYKTTKLEPKDSENSNLYIFKDEKGHCHFAIETKQVKESEVKDPNINGLKLGVFKYRFKDGKVCQFIDLSCNIMGYMEEYTEVVREIAEAVLKKKKTPLVAITQIINNWISFWGAQSKQTLTEEQQIGLICELIILNELCELNPNTALDCWIGPLGGKHDFNFTDWSLEIKGTRMSGKTHTINGIEQLSSEGNKRLAFVSFLLANSQSNKSLSLPSLIESIIEKHFKERPALIIKLNKLLASVGYSPVHRVEYEKYRIEVVEASLFEVNKDFPKLTPDMLIAPLNSRITAIRYNISLKEMVGKTLSKINWSDYFY